MCDCISGHFATTGTIRVVYRIGSVWHDSKGWAADQTGEINRFLAHVHVLGAKDVKVLCGNCAG